MIVAGLLLDGSRHHDGPAAPVTIAGVSVWIVPPQRHADNPSEVGNTYDGNPRTYWSTVKYFGRNFGGYGGEGLAVHLSGVQPLHHMAVTSFTTGWAASTYVSASDAPTLAGWGVPTAQQSNVDGSTTFDLGGRAGSWVLLWMTDTGPTLTLEINELHVS